MGGNAQSLAGKTQMLFRGSLDAHGVHRQAESRRQIGPHGRDVRGQLWPLAEDGGVDVFHAGFGRPDMNSLMRQAQKMQEDMKAKQAELEAAEYTGSASGEMVTVKMNGKHEVLSITIKPEAVDPDDIEMLEDLVAAAVNATVKQVDETAEAEMGKLTGGLNIPGL